MAKEKVTPAIRLLRSSGIDFEVHSYRYNDKGGAPHAAVELDVPLHQMIKTIVLQDEMKRFMFVLMHGDKEVSTRQLARQLQVKQVSPANPKDVFRITGYQIGGTSPFGSRSPLPVYIESSILDYDQIYINGGGRGTIIRLASKHLTTLLKGKPVSVGV
jgi:Cys-tRNA(Pro) deacylase